MPLRFVQQHGGWNDRRKTVRFFAFDGDKPVVCMVTREALVDLERARDADGKMCVGIFEKHRSRIEAAAAAKYQPGAAGRDPFVVVETADLN
jgi:hypothetical protein